MIIAKATYETPPPITNQWRLEQYQHRLREHFRMQRDIETTSREYWDRRAMGRAIQRRISEELRRGN